MNRLTSILGLISSWGLLFLVIIYLTILFSPLIIPQENVWKPSITTYDKPENDQSWQDVFGNFACFSAAILTLALFSCFHDQAPGSRKIFSRIAMSLIIISTSLQFLDLTFQWEIEQLRIFSDDKQEILLSIFGKLGTVVSGVYWFSVTILTGLAELMLVPVFSNKITTEKNLRIVFLISGILSLLMAVPFRTAYGERSGVVLLLSQIFMIIVMIFCIKFFKRAKITRYEE